ncbi:MAG: hypothetical protein L6437_08245, partial [Kiritimatiellae bacterium]|nr:hypothetical protein [Kiritimatiellia bacterium]
IFCGPPVFCATDGRDLAKEFFRLVGARPFTLADYQQAYLKHLPFPTRPTAVNRFHWPLEPVAADVVFTTESGCSGVKRHGLETYYLSGVDPREKLRELAQKLDTDDRLAVDAFNAIATVYDEGEATVLAVTGRYDQPWSGVIRVDRREVRVKSARLLLLRLGPRGCEAIGERIKDLTVDGHRVAATEMDKTNRPRKGDGIRS